MSLSADVRYALRLMAKSPGFTAVLVLTLALGIGASTTIFSVVHSVVVKPLPYRDPDQLVRVYTEFAAPANLRKFWVSPPEYNDLVRSCRSCASIAALDRGTASFAGSDRPLRVDAAYATHTLADTLGVRPALGRFYDASEDRFGGDPTVAVIGHDLWKRGFGGDPGVIGRKVMLDAMPVTIVGVMPAGFDYPGGMEAWVPARIDPASTRRGSHHLEVTVRLAPGVSLAGFRGELASLMAGWSAGQTRGPGGRHHINADQHPMLAFPLKGEVVGSLATTLWLLQGAVLFVLLIAIANVTNLLLARAEARSREIAVRHAVGATRPRLVRQLLTESVVLGLVGGGLGVLVAVWALDATVALIPPSAPRVREITLDAASLWFALACTLASSLLFGLAPILHTRRTDVHHALKDGARSSGSRTRLRIRRGLVVAEVALAMVLVVGCALMVKRFVRLQQVELGFAPDHLLVFELELPPAAYPDATVNPFWRRVEERVRALPGVTGATLVTGRPPVRRLDANDLFFPGRPRPDRATLNWNTDYWQVVGDDAFAVLGARIVRGRALGPGDVQGAPGAVVVNEAFAKKFFRPDEDPVGQRVSVAPWGDTPPEQTIVGVVADIKQNGVDRPAGTEAYFTAWQAPDVVGEPYRTMNVVVRTTGDPGALTPAVQRAIADLDPRLPVSKLRTMDDLLWEAVARPRFLTFLLGAFAVIALILAAIGIYGVMAYTVAQRTHEIGIRTALGARPGQVRAMVLRQAGAIVGFGLAVGLVAAFGLELLLDRALATALYGERLRDPLLFVAVGLVVTAAAGLATWLPARRATRVHPTVALRSE